MGTDEDRVETPEQRAALTAGTWVQDAAGEFWCLFDTHVIWPQLMWKPKGRTTFVHLEGIPMPLQLAEINKDGFVCPHTRTNECGQCLRCGEPMVVAPDDNDAKVWGAIGIRIEKDEEQG